MSLLRKSLQFKWLLSTLFVPPLSQWVQHEHSRGPESGCKAKYINVTINQTVWHSQYSNAFYLTQQQCFLVLPSTCQCGSYDNREACQFSGSVQWGRREGGKQTEWGVREIFHRSWSQHRISVNNEENKKEKGTFGKDIDDKIIYFLWRMTQGFKFCF